MLTTNLIESELSIAYVLAIAAHSGFATEVKRIDMDSVDITVEAKGALTPKSILHSPKIDIQLKASYSCDLSDPNEIPFDLKLKNYDELRGNYMVPRILVVLSSCITESMVNTFSKRSNFEKLRILDDIEGTTGCYEWHTKKSKTS